jgi:hypothetical protein
MKEREGIASYEEKWLPTERQRMAIFMKRVTTGG